MEQPPARRKRDEPGPSTPFASISAGTGTPSWDTFPQSPEMREWVAAASQPQQTRSSKQQRAYAPPGPWADRADPEDAAMGRELMAMWDRAIADEERKRTEDEMAS